MTAALAARGPDGDGFHVAPGVGLGHRRLAVIDVAGGRQPLHSEDGQVTAIVNGELYNFRQLRATLERAGHRFATACDAEVVVHGYEEWGDGVLGHLQGMFALAVWDARRRRLLLARDRMGEKPLYWATLPGGGLAFSSELKSLCHAPGVDTALDPGSLARYLVHECVPAPRSILRGVCKLAPGTRLVVEAGAAPVVSTFWDLSFSEGPRITNEEEGARLLLGELRRSVRERLISDVPLGVFLSGGVDSSAVAALAAEVRGGDLDTFTIGFDDPAFDESAAAARVARFIGSRHHEQRLTAASVSDALVGVGSLLDEPLGDASIIPTHLLARFARNTATVCLGGDGGDDLFGGYPTFAAEPLAKLLFDRAPGAGRAAAALAKGVSALLPSSGGYLPLEFKLKQFFRASNGGAGRRHQAWMASFLPTEALAVLAPDVRNMVIATGANLYDVVDARWDSGPGRLESDRLLCHYVKGYLAEDLLPKLDRATMAVGLEARSPLLAEGVVSLACRLAPSLRQRAFPTKHILKRALRGLLPDETLHRKKQGFAMPIGRWLAGPLRPFMEDTLSPRALRDCGLFDPAPIRRLVDEHLQGRSDNRKPLWTLLAFMRWHEAWRSRPS